MNMKEMGQNLRQGRERMGLSVDDVVQRTKISKVNVLALEAGDVEGLPHPVYAKGFVRNYAKLLGLEAEAYAEVLGREFLVEDNVAPPQPEGEAAAEPSTLAESEGGRWKVLVAGLVLLACLVGVVVFMYSGENGDMTVEEAAVPAETAPASVERAAPEVAAPAQEPQAEADQEAVEGQSVGEQPAEAGEVAAQPAPEVAASMEAAPEEAAPVAEQAGEKAAEEHVAQAVDGRQRVTIKADEPCWILATIDGGEAQGGVLVDIMLQPGQSKLLRYAKTMVVKLGNAGGVRITRNGKPYDFDAKSGQVRTLTFPEG